MAFVNDSQFTDNVRLHMRFSLCRGNMTVLPNGFIVYYGWYCWIRVCADWKVCNAYIIYIYIIR